MNLDKFMDYLEDERGLGHSFYDPFVVDNLSITESKVAKLIKNALKCDLESISNDNDWSFSNELCRDIEFWFNEFAKKEDFYRAAVKAVSQKAEDVVADNLNRVTEEDE